MSFRCSAPNGAPRLNIRFCWNKAQENQRRRRLPFVTAILANDFNGLASVSRSEQAKNPIFPNRFTQNRAEVPAVA
jgi:hypothetical protein